jgi:hypothetical protein
MARRDLGDESLDSYTWQFGDLFWRESSSKRRGTKFGG